MPARTDTNPATTSKSNSERAEKTPRYLFNLSLLRVDVDIERDVAACIE